MTRLSTYCAQAHFSFFSLFKNKIHSKWQQSPIETFMYKNYGVPKKFCYFFSSCYLNYVKILINIPSCGHILLLSENFMAKSSLMFIIKVQYYSKWFTQQECTTQDTISHSLQSTATSIKFSKMPQPLSSWKKLEERKLHVFCFIQHVNNTLSTAIKITQTGGPQTFWPPHETHGRITQVS